MIHLQDIWFQYGTKPLFSQLDLDIMEGNIYGLLGMNGAGKSTLLKIIAGQLFCQQGEVTVMGYHAPQRKAEMLADVFYLAEDFFLPSWRGTEYVKIYAPFYPRFDENAFTAYCEQFALDKTQKLNELSYGQKKKFLLAFGLAANTSLSILDEPTNGLDIPSKSQFRRTIASAMTENRTFIISTHQVRDMENLIDPIVIIHNGHVVFNSSLASITQRYTMVLEHVEPKKDEALYVEKVPGGWMTVRNRKAGQPESPIDLETLFNAVIANPRHFLSGGSI